MINYLKMTKQNDEQNAYECLVENYLKVGQAVSDRSLPKTKLEILIDSDLTLLGKLENLSPDQLTKIQ